MKEYIKMLHEVMSRGVLTENRTGIGTYTIFGYQLRLDLRKGLPLVTTKQLHLKSVVYELLWFLRGDTNVKYLHDNNVHIWDPWVKPDGEVGPIYGAQWRKWHALTGLYDQIQQLIYSLKINPTSRRLVVSAWNVGDIQQMCTPPCPFAFQCHVQNGRLSMHVFVRSWDVFLGAPFDIAEYAILLHLLAHQTGLKASELLFSATNVHLYCNHIKQAGLQLHRDPLPLPTFDMQYPVASIDHYTYDMIMGAICGYTSHPAIKALVAV